MPPTPPAKVETKSRTQGFGMMILCLAGILAFLFAKSFKPELTLFSNDGPLGVISGQADYAVSNFRAVWLHLNWIGVKSFSSPPNITNILFIILGNITFSKVYVPVSLFILGLSAWLLFRQLGFRPWICVLGGLAIALNTDPFSYACWGLASLPLSMAGFFLALAALAQFPGRFAWIRAGLAGSALGLSLMEGYDNGAIFSLYTAAFAFFQSWNRPGEPGAKIGKGVARVAVVAVIAALASAHTLSDLFTTQVKGVAVAESAEQRWNNATQWSLPKIETLRLAVSGMFGYRMDTPAGGEYWGGVGRTPGWEETHQGLPRHSGAGVYAGVLVVFVAIWAALQGLLTKGVFDTIERRFVCFWALAAIVSLLLAFGRHAPFYQLIYPLPFFSTMRNPIKFIHPLSVALVILFAYGLEGLHRRYLNASNLKPAPLSEHLARWWKTVSGFDKRWVCGSAAILGLSVLGWLAAASSRPELERYLGSVGFDPAESTLVAKYSAKEIAWFVLYLALATGAVLLMLSGWFTGGRTRWMALFCGFILVTDLARANSPWIIYYNYREDYASNPLLDLLRQKPYEHRVAGRLLAMGGGYLAREKRTADSFASIYEGWLQSLFQFYQVQSPDIIQMPRMSQVDKTLLSTFANGSSLQLFSRLWQLTSTRYVLGEALPLDGVNQEFDPIQKRFKIQSRFDFFPKPTATPPITRPEQITMAFKPDGQFALYEFTGALPRAALFSNWQLTPSDEATLAQLTNPTFDPLKTVLVASETPAPAPALVLSTNQMAASAEITSYSPKQIKVQANAAGTSVLLMNDHYDPSWNVTIDGKRDKVLRLNYLFNGVLLPAGNHSVEFRFQPPVTSLYMSLGVIAFSILGCVLLVIAPGTTKD